MKQEELFLLDALRSFVREEKPSFDALPDPERLLALASDHAVAGVLGYMALQTPAPCIAPLLPALKSHCYAEVASGVRRMADTQELLERLEAEGIDHLMFKGFVVREYYPMPDLRSFGDVDLLIHAEDRSRCHALMLSLGATVKTDWEPVYTYVLNNRVYEVHTEIVDTDISEQMDCRSYFRSVWEHAVCMGGHRYEPAPEYHFLYLLTHIAKHIHGAGAGIRMYMDLAVFLRHFGSSPDWAWVDRELESLGLRSFANAALTLTERCFGIESPIPLSPMEDAAYARFLEFTMSGGLFGFTGRDSGVLTLKNAPSTRPNRFLTIVRRLFPPVDALESRYTYLRKRHWLLPVAWVHRFFRTRSTWGQHAQEAKNILSADADAVEKLKTVCSELGLE